MQKFIYVKFPTKLKSASHAESGEHIVPFLVYDDKKSTASEVEKRAYTTLTLIALEMAVTEASGDAFMQEPQFRATSLDCLRAAQLILQSAFTVSDGEELPHGAAEYLAELEITTALAANNPATILVGDILKVMFDSDLVSNSEGLSEAIKHARHTTTIRKMLKGMTE
jgi:hypothetical protein